jgi:hypothetical protein
VKQSVPGEAEGIPAQRLLGRYSFAEVFLEFAEDLAANASFTNTIGDALLFGYWTDPDFDPSHHAFYYVRVIGIPIPRWTAFDAKIFGIDLGEDTVMKLQGRAYTSPNGDTP